MTALYAWATPPTLAQLHDFLTQHNHRKHLIFCLRDTQKNIFRLPENATPTQQHLYHTLTETTRCLVFDAVNYIADFLPQTDLWLMPTPHHARLHEHFPNHQNIIWQDQALPQQPPTPLKTWQLPPEYPAIDPAHILIIGAGIAGAATAYECAKRGYRVSVLEAQEEDVAQAASGNRQGLLYAKISPHHTAQTELLLSGYGYTRRLLAQLLPEQNTWHASGVLHLNHNATETQRNDLLAKNIHYHHLYRPVCAQEASQIAGIALTQSALFWEQGVWLNPPSLVRALLQHPNISVYTHQTAQHIEYKNERWHIHTQQNTFDSTHIVFCTGANSAHTPIISDFPTQIIRGQTSLVAATAASQNLRTALSGASYISPEWNGTHCFGATFIPNNDDSTWQAADDAHNIAELHQLIPSISQQFDFSKNTTGHAALRCDCHDHLPAVGALGDVAAMQTVYAKLALDKNYRIATRCPYLPRAFANLGHGSRGLATAPLCAAQIAAQIAGEATPFSERLRQALNPNRLIIRKIIRGKSSPYE